MLTFERSETDPFFNIAAEEYLLKSVREDCFMLWQNSPSVIIGKHQNMRAEVRSDRAAEKGIPVIRRISGGGAVYHDPGNLNFTFIATGEREKLVDFKKFMEPVRSALNAMGIPAVTGSKNDLRADGLKISGNAEHAYRNRILHHGTLLVSTDLTMMDYLLSPPEHFFQDKAVKSNRSQVVNISTLVPDFPGMDFLKKHILKYIGRIFPLRYTTFNQTDLTNIRKLVDSKYGTDEWNMGYSPEYLMKSALYSGTFANRIEIKVRGGVIREIHSSDGRLAQWLNNFLAGSYHDYVAIERSLPDPGTAGFQFSRSAILKALI